MGKSVVLRFFFCRVYMQLASGFIQLAAAGRIGLLFFTAFLKGKMLIVH